MNSHGSPSAIAFFRASYLIGCASVFAVIHAAAAPIPVSGVLNYTQNFNSFGTASTAWVNDSTIPGWYAQINNGATATGTLQVSSGAVDSQNGLLNLGAAGSSDRALGSKATSTGNLANISYGVQFQNTSAVPVRLALVSYAGEYWRTNSEVRSDVLRVYYAISASRITDLRSGASDTLAAAGTGFVSPDSGNLLWTAPVNSPVSAALDGNAAANRMVVSYSPDGIIVNPGQHLMIKWTDANEQGTDGCPAIDDVTVQFVPMTGAPGAVDPGFNPNVLGSGLFPDVRYLAVQPDGKVLIGGSFNNVGGTARSGVVRLNSNGTLDTAFNPGVTSLNVASSVQPDSRILVHGGFESIGGVTRRNLARLMPNGLLDAGYSVTVDGSTRSIPLADGQTLLCGSFAHVNGAERLSLAKVNSSGVLDPAFSMEPGGGSINAVQQEDGNLVFGGSFTEFNGRSRRYLARFDAFGFYDSDFVPELNELVRTMVLQADGKLLVAGGFNTVNGIQRPGIARLNPDGSLDEAFNLGLDAPVNTYCLMVQTDGKILCCGNFQNIAGSPYFSFARLNPDGTIDADFHPNPEDFVMGFTLQADGKILAGGRFTSMAGVSRNLVARLENSPATQSLTVPSLSRIEWLRGGSSPETPLVNFELSVNNGGAWTPLGNGVRIPGGWELTGVTLPSTGKVRASARISGGYYNDSWSVLQTVADYSFSAQQAWRQLHFGTMENTGAAGDHADPDNDGLENLVEFAFGLNPNDGGGALPAWQKSDSDFVFNFTQPSAVSGVSYTAEYNASLDPAGWTPIPNSAVPPAYTFQTPAVSGRLYLRVRVILP